MKHFKIEQKPFAIGGKYIITDEKDHEEYIAKGNPFSFRRHTSLEDSLGNITYEFHKKLFSWKQIFFIHEYGVPAYRLFKNRVSIPPEIFIESLENSDAFYVKGNFWGMEYDFYNGEHKFASVSKKFPSFTDVYSVQIEEGQNEALIFTVVLIIDIMKESKKKKG